MSASRTLLSLTVVSLLFGGCSASRATPPPTAETLAQFHEDLIALRKRDKVLSLSVALVHDGKIVFAEGIGWQDHDAEEPTTKDTSYLVASITKTFTGATLLAMEADGHIDLDAPFTSLSDWPGRCAWLSTAQTIFAGGTLDDGTVIEPPRCDTPFSLRQVLQHRVNGEPGTSFFYNPIVFGRLSNWVEENTDRTWRDWMRHYVIDPAGLHNVAAGWRDPGGSEALRNLAPPFRLAPEQSDGLDPSALPNPELNASSGIIASAVDLAKYSIALDDEKILPAELREKMWTPPRDANGEPAHYANGWWVQTWQGHRLVWHGGWWPDAYAGLLLKVPDAGWTLVALGNTDGLNWNNPLHRARVHESPIGKLFLETFVEP